MPGVVPANIIPTGLTWESQWKVEAKPPYGFQNRGRPVASFRIMEFRPAKTRTPRALNCSRRSSGSRYA